MSETEKMDPKEKYKRIKAMRREISRAGPESMYYGLNAMSDNLIMVDRKLLPNPSGLILGKPGAGRAFQSREEIAEEIKKT